MTQAGNGEETGISLGHGNAGSTTLVRPEIERGTGQFVGQGASLGEGPQAPLPTQGGGDISLDFVNADIRDVVRSVLGNILHLPYVIEPGVQGNVTLQTSRPIPTSLVLPTLEAALRLSGVAVIESNRLYEVVPISAAARDVAMAGSAENGFITRIISPQYVAASDLQRVLGPLLPPGSSVRADPSRNILIVSGTGQDVDDIVNDIGIFDVDYLHGLSFALLPLRNAQAKDVAQEVTTMLGGSGAPIAGMVRALPINRLNAVLVTAMRPVYLDRVRSWIQRLDSGGAGDSGQQLFVYRVQNGRASDLASVLTKTLGIESTSGGTSSTSPLGAPTSESGSSGSGFGGAAGSQPPGADASGISGVPGILQGGLPGGSQAASPQATEAAGSPGGLGMGAENALSDVRITADEQNNALLILATPQEYTIIQSALRQLDILPLQVLIEATVAEVDLTGELSYGLQYSIQSGRFGAIFSSGSSTTAGPSVPGFNSIYTPNVNSSVVLQALDQITKVKVLSSPDLLVLNDQSARLQVGDEVPIATQSAVSVTTPGAPVVNSIEYQDTGVILQVTPRVNASGLVLLDISQQVSDVSTTTTSTLNSPTFTQRSVNSSVAISDGQTLVLAGLIKDTRSNSKTGIPLLDDIPYLGALFSVRDTSVTRTELIVLITPHVIRDRAAGQAITNELQEKLPLTIPVVMDRRP
ncbi:MAG TPA: type II secretion system secretin GspD [Acetobacteraceae bacterium]|nr:type II secretion system secretin GspD [Acetobacteraceae bacterium]